MHISPASAGFIGTALSKSYSNTYPNPETLTGLRPTSGSTGLTLDPTLIRRSSDNQLFLYTTGTNCTVWTSSSLYGPWTQCSQSGLSSACGAPSLYNVDNTYYMFYSHDFNYSSVNVTDPDAVPWYHDSIIAVATSDTLEPRSWTDHGRLNISWSDSYNVLDGNFLQYTNASTDNTQNVLGFGSYYDGLFSVPLADRPTKLADGASPTHLAQNKSDVYPNTGPDPIEGSYQFQWGEYYYLFFSSGTCCIGTLDAWPDAGDVYKVMVCRADSPLGPYVDKEGKSCLTENGGTEILASHDGVWAPGGQGVVEDEEAGGVVIYYHYLPYNTTTGVVTNQYFWGWNHLDFGTDGWPTVVANSTAAGKTNSTESKTNKAGKPKTNAGSNSTATATTTSVASSSSLAGKIKISSTAISSVSEPSDAVPSTVVAVSRGSAITRRNWSVANWMIAGTIAIIRI